MTDRLLRAQDHLIDAMARAARGPKRNGLFALWLLVRLADDLLPPRLLAERTLRRRLDRLERRLSSLSLPASLRRACVASVEELRHARIETATQALERLIAPARDSVSRDAGDAVARALEDARRASR